VLHWPAALEVVRLALHAYYPVGQDFLLRNLEASAREGGAQLSAVGALWVLLGGAGIFIPLELAFNRLWGFHEQRPYWRNQLVGFVLTLACWLIVLGLVLGVARLPPAAREPLLRLGTVAGAACAIFLFYRFLPNGRVTGRAALPAAVVTVLAAEVVRWIFTLLLPLVDLPSSQGPFHVSVSFLVFVYVEAFVVLTGAYLAAEAMREERLAPAKPPRGQILVLRE
jgi:membrane protein